MRKISLITLILLGLLIPPIPQNSSSSALEQLKNTAKTSSGEDYANPKTAVAPSPFILSPRERRGRGGWTKTGERGPKNIKKTKDWTIMTFINARNNLSVSGPQSVNMMEKIGSSERINVLAELGTSDDKGISRRYEIKKDTVPSQITSPYQSMEDSDMGDWKTLSEFAKWGVKNYPAKHYMLIVWGHGLGRRDPESDIGVGQERGISFDDSTGNFIRNSQLGRALKDIGVKLDVYASDACIMQMASVVYEIKDSAEFIVGSEETIFTFSFPYEAILKRLDSGDISALQASKIITEEYQKMYKIPPPGFKGTMISAVRAGALPAPVNIIEKRVVGPGLGEDSIKKGVSAAGITGRSGGRGPPSSSSRR